jgi:tetratricopeptide (TPR) repeat protein
LAVIVASVDTVGWAVWRQVADSLAVDQQAAAQRIVGNPLVALPSVISRSRRLAANRFTGLAPEVMTTVLTRVGTLQRQWAPTNSAGFVNLAREEFLRGRRHASLDALQEALKRDPTSPFLHRLRALFLFSIGETSTAFSAMATAEAIAPGMRNPAIDLLPSEEERLRIEGLRLRGNHYPRRQVETTLELARAVRARGNYGEARSLLAGLRGRPRVEIEIARWSIEARDFDGAIELCMPVASRSSNPRRIRADAWSVIAVALDLSGDGRGSLGAAEAALELDPQSAKPYVTLAGLAQGRGDLEIALEHLRRAWGMDPANVRLLTRIAWVAEQAGKPADALLALERAVEIEPGSARLAGLLVELQLRTGHYSEAATTLSRALDRHPTDASLLRLADRLQREIGVR